MLFFSQTLYGINRGNISEYNIENQTLGKQFVMISGEQLSVQTHRVLILLADHKCVWYTSFLRLLWQSTTAWATQIYFLTVQRSEILNGFLWAEIKVSITLDPLQSFARISVYLSLSGLWISWIMVSSLFYKASDVDCRPRFSSYVCVCISVCVCVHKCVCVCVCVSSFSL